LAHTIEEVRTLMKAASKYKVVTQLGNQGHSFGSICRLCEWVWAGAIGPIRQVINWSSRPFWPQALERPRDTPPVPAGLDWDLWLGPAPERSFHPAYLPFVWRGWHDFGSGALGDMGHYSFDTIFRVLKLEAPTSVQASSTDRFAETFPRASIIHFDFPARGDLPPVTLTWYDGGLKPPRPEGLAADSALEDEGLMFLGDHGTILCEFNGRHPRIIPESRMKEFQQPPRTLPRSPGTLREWLDACKGSKTRPGASFEFSGPVVESLQLGNVALRKGREVVWDRAGLKAVDDGEAQRTINPEHRAGWAV
jgi:predicted dehydrogenase